MSTQAEIGKHLDLSPRHVRELRDLGVIDLDGPLDAIRVAYIRHLRAGKGGHSTASLTEARARKEAVAADLAELELARAKGELLVRSAVEAAHHEVVAHFRRGLRALSKATVTALGLSPAQSRKLEAMIDRCLNELARFNFGRKGSPDRPRGTRGRARRAGAERSERRTA